eukprot:CAMPEP_0178376314 /NCGR_PEP_ID=MMETSP0689_2-20121128/3338_1 /TAXON_ID=160604 /ORGANISM="Amphidinium massartii, Strain CS-259" /LENGTH=96 /DNA_ID=CAMNT_0019996331 /DNA_START=436 /DNA_END=726 /DNA_ORIENTATION=+
MQQGPWNWNLLGNWPQREVHAQLPIDALLYHQATGSGVKHHLLSVRLEVLQDQASCSQCGMPTQVNLDSRSEPPQIVHALVCGLRSQIAGNDEGSF